MLTQPAKLMRAIPVALALAALGIPGHAHAQPPRKSGLPTDPCARVLRDVAKYLRNQAPNGPESHPAIDHLERHLRGEDRTRSFEDQNEVARLMAKGQTRSAALQTLGLPPHTASLYDAETGAFRLPEPTHGALAAENGDLPLRAVRINYQAETAFRGTDGFKNLLEDYRLAMEQIPGFELWILRPRDGAARLDQLIQALPKAIRLRIKTLEANGHELSPWAQDYSKPLEGPPATLGRALSHRTHDDIEVRDQYPPYQKVAVTESALPFEGGNVIVGRRQVFVGPDVITDTTEKFRISRPEARAALAKEFGKPILELGAPVPVADLHYLKQTTFHIDLSLAIVADRRTPGAPEVAVLSSPYALFERVFGIKDIAKLGPNEFRAQLVAAVDKLEGDIAAGGRKPMTQTEKQFVSSVLRVPLAEIRERELELQAVAKTLREQGYEVRTVPGWEDGDGKGMTTFNYTNVILTPGHALIPHYDIPMLDAAARNVYRYLGYEPQPMRSVQQYICASGGPRCASETYRRSLRHGP